MPFDRQTADRISDQIVEMLKAEIRRSEFDSALSLLAGQTLALLSFLKTLPRPGEGEVPLPDEIQYLEAAALVLIDKLRRLYPGNPVSSPH